MNMLSFVTIIASSAASSATPLPWAGRGVADDAATEQAHVRAAIAALGEDR